MEPQKILIFGLGFIFIAGITLFISFKLQSSIKTKKNKNLVNLLSFMFLAVASIFIFRMYSQEYIAALTNQSVNPTGTGSDMLRHKHENEWRISISNQIFISPLFSSALFGLAMFYFFRWVFIERYNAEEAKNYAMLVAFACAAITYGTVS